ncbi:MAG: DNA polymerase III subunit delta [Actinobacteria bacterium]|nr:DNA polymerase III subunit delta [Actinomycetota bacterium]
MSADLKPVYLLSGTDRPKIEEALRRLRARVGEGGSDVLSAAESSGDDVVASCNAPGLFAIGARAVVVNQVESWKAADAKAVAAYLSDPAPSTVLALVGIGLKKDSPLAKACAKVGELLFYDVPKSKLPTWVAERFRALGAGADRDACRLLVEVVGDNVTELETEIHKLATWAGGDTVDAAAVEALAAGRAEVPIFALTDSWGARDVAAVLQAAESILERPERTRRDEVTRIAARFASHVQTVREIQDLATEGVTPREAASRLRRNPYYVQKLFAQAANFSAEELGSALVRAAALDLAVKGGSRLPTELELDRGLADATLARANS